MITDQPERLRFDGRKFLLPSNHIYHSMSHFRPLPLAMSEHIRGFLTAKVYGEAFKPRDGIIH